MFLRFTSRRLTLLFLLFLAGAPLLQLKAQEEPDFDISAPIDTTESQLTAKGGGPINAPITDAAIKEKLAALEGCLQLRTNAVVRSYIRHYVYVKTEKTRTMLGKRLTYFPMFEQKLREYGLPLDLKYLSVVESALNPKAVSRVGATGLWQFMPYTGSDYGLRTNSAVEERSDPVKSTEAAMRYLKDLYIQFDDWALALAAYNSGPNRVNSAIKRARSRNFWTIQRFLPEETRNYVPAFIAATYICNYFSQHGLDPHEPDLDQQLTSFLKIHEGLSFKDIAEATGVDYNTVKTLNPSYNRGYVPPNANGSYVSLPRRVMPAFVRYLNTLGVRVYKLDDGANYATSETGDGRYWKTLIQADKEETLESLATRLGHCADHIKSWNGLTANFVVSGQALALWNPVFVQQHQKIKIPGQDGKVSAKQKINTGVVGPQTMPPSAPHLPTPATAYLSTPVRREQKIPVVRYHTLRRHESLEDVARLYGTTMDNLKNLNGNDPVQVGSRIRLN